MATRKSLKPIAASIGAAVVASTMALSTANAAESPFVATELSGGYMLAGAEGKCGEGKCGGDKAKEGSCGGKAMKEGSCGGKAKEGSCGGDKAKEGSCGGKAKEGSCGGDKAKEGKCGEGKCGS